MHKADLQSVHILDFAALQSGASVDWLLTNVAGGCSLFLLDLI